MVLLVIESSRVNGREFLQGISRYADVRGPWLFHFGQADPFYRTDDYELKENSAAWLPKWNPNGIITCNPSLTQKFTEAGIPTIFVTDPANESIQLPRVILEHKEISEMAAKEFLTRGYTNIGYCGFDEYIWSQKRKASFVEYLSKSKSEVHCYSSKTKNWDQEKKSLSKWLKQLPKPIGIFACNDDRGRDIIEVCKAENIEIPLEVAVLGVDNDYMVCNYCTPPLSSIKLDAGMAGYKAAELLDKMMMGHSVNEQTIVIHPLEIENRQSTDILSICDNDVNEAIKYIREHCYENIRVDDVANAIAVPKRKLMEKFRNIVGRTISDEIKRSCAEKISKMLIDTELSVQQIAVKFGYDGLNHIARFFKQQTGFTPTEYREKYRRG
jgi:LacI family transcriptional regulator